MRAPHLWTIYLLLQLDSAKGIYLNAPLNGHLLLLPSQDVVSYTAQHAITETNIWAVHNDRFQFQSTFPGLVAIQDQTIAQLTIKTVMRRSKQSVPDAHDELQWYDRRRKLSWPEWTSITLFEEIRRLAASTTSRRLICQPFSR